MKRFLLWPLLAAVVVCTSSCGKQQTEAERNAEVERQVQQRLETEHQAQAQKDVAQRQADLDAREAALAAKENQPAPTAIPAAPRLPNTQSAPVQAETADNGSYATFYRKLDPYGDWFETSNYGYVFQPRQAAQRDWRPYTVGHWVYTDAGWTWISDEPFGWATYHYGRWARLRGTGWVWVPGEEWAAAWVSWRSGNDYVGWAPLPPEARFNRETGIHQWADNYYDIGPEQYAFVPVNEFGGALSARVVVATGLNITIIDQTTNITNLTYSNSIVVNRGPSYDDMRARSRQPIERRRLERTQNFNDERPVLRGEVVAIPVRDFRPAARDARPQRVRRNLAQPTVERGWEGIANAAAAQKARAKMETEATPPSNLPPRKFVPPVAPAAIAATPPPIAAPPATARPTRPFVRQTPPATPAPTATPVPTARPTRPPVRQTPPATPAPTDTPAPTARPARPFVRQTPPPPAAQPILNPPSETSTPPPEPRNDRPRPLNTPAAATPPPAATAAPAEPPVRQSEQPRLNPAQERRERMLEQRKQRLEQRNAAAEENASPTNQVPGRVRPNRRPIPPATSPSPNQP